MDIIAKVDEISGETVYFTRGLGIAPGVGDVLAETHLDCTGSLKYTCVYVQNHRGDTIALVSNGTVTARLEYDAWGKPEPLTPEPLTPEPSVTPFFTFSGKHWDADADLYYYGFSWYDPIAKRWTQPDPSGLAEGLDLYRFCGNDPVDDLDTYGLESVNLHGYLKKDPMGTIQKRWADANGIWPGIVTVAGHADWHNFYISLNGEQRVMYAETLAKLIKAAPDYAPCKPIVLFCCYSGYGDDSPAEQLSRLLPNMILAPTSFTTTGLVDYKSIIASTFAYPTSIPSDQNGYWRSFQGGAAVIQTSQPMGVGSADPPLNGNQVVRVSGTYPPPPPPPPPLTFNPIDPPVDVNRVNRVVLP